MAECKKCIHEVVCESAKSCDGRVPGCEHFKEQKQGRMDMQEKLVELLWDAFELTDNELPTMEQVADHLIANGVTVQEWISVNDRLPEKEGFYLVATKYGTVYRELYFLCGDPPEPSFGWDGVSKGKYTHWMPLPQPPKGE